jgi:hypothetical protein
VPKEIKIAITAQMLPHKEEKKMIWLMWENR